MPETHDLGDGYLAVPYDSTTLNGLFLPQLLATSKSTSFAVMKNGRALRDENESTYRYKSLQEAREDVETLKRILGSPP